MLEEAPLAMRSGTPDRVVIDSPPTSVSADEVVAFEAIIYDPVNNVLAGDIHWSASNGSISDDGLFYPWSAGLVEITAEHNGLVARHNVSVEAGVPTSIEITRLSWGARAHDPHSGCAGRRGNRMPGPATMVWDIDGVYAGLGEPRGRQKNSAMSRPFDSINWRLEPPSPSRQVRHTPLCLSNR